jgi:hypothetical protein
MRPEHWGGCVAVLLYAAATTLRVQRWPRSDPDLPDGGWAARGHLWWVAERCGVVDHVDVLARRHEATRS